MKFLLSLLFLTTLLFSSIGQVTALRGKATLLRNTKSFDVQPGFKLEAKDVLSTAKNSRAQIIFNDGTVVTIGKKSQLDIAEYLYDEIDSKNSKTSFKFLKGSFKSITGKIGHIAPDKFKLKTTNASIGIRGTTVIGDQSKVACTQGKITVSSHGVTQFVPAGMMTTTPKNAAPTTPVAYKAGSMAIDKKEKTKDKAKSKEDKKSKSKTKSNDKKTTTKKEEKKNSNKVTAKNEDKKESAKPIAKKKQIKSTVDEKKTISSDNKALPASNDGAEKDKSSTTITSEEESSPVAQEPTQNDIKGGVIVANNTPDAVVVTETSSVEVPVADAAVEAPVVEVDVTSITETAATAVTDATTATTEIIQENTTTTQASNIITSTDATTSTDTTTSTGTTTSTDTTQSTSSTQTLQDFASVPTTTSNLNNLTSGTTGLHTAGITVVDTSYLEYGYWDNANNIEVGTYVSGIATATEYMDQVLQTGGTASYTAGVKSIVTAIDGTTQYSDGSVNVYMNYGTGNFTGNIDVTQGGFKADVAGSISRYGFESTSVSAATGDTAGVNGGALNGKFYGPNAAAVGGTFNLNSSNSGSVSGVFSGTGGLN